MLQHALFQNGHPVGQGHGFNLIVGYIERCNAKGVLHMLQFSPHVAAQFGIEIGQGLIHQEHRRAADDGAGQGHTLFLTTRQFAGVAVQQRFKLHLRCCLADCDFHFCGIDFAHFQRKANILAHCLVRIKRVGLEHHRYVAVFRQYFGYVSFANPHVARGCSFETAENAQRCGFARA